MVEKCCFLPDSDECDVVIVVVVIVVVVVVVVVAVVVVSCRRSTWKSFRRLIRSATITDVDDGDGDDQK